MTEAGQVLVPIVAAVVAVPVALLVAVLVGMLARSLARRSVVASGLVRRGHRPLRAVLVVIAVWGALLITVPEAAWQDNPWLSALAHALAIALIAAVTWLAARLTYVMEDLTISRYRVDVKDNRHARRVRTQVQLLRRITVAVLVVVGLAVALLTFPGVSAFGASLLASAGVLSVVAGLAAQSSLSNVFAGLQLAFTDAIRVDDVVVVEKEWGRIEEITLTYVVVHVWDDRRLILPSTYFIKTPFENWTRRAADLLGTVELDVDWQVPVEEMRAELGRLLADTDLWDRRVGVLQVTGAVAGQVRVRALASAADAPTLFDLRCYLREGLVAWLQHTAPQGLPRTRIEQTEALSARPSGGSAGVGAGQDGGAQNGGAHDGGAQDGGAHEDGEVEAGAVGGQQDARLFTGSVAAEKRWRSFAGPGQDVIDEREEHAAEAMGKGPERRVEEVTAPAQESRTGAAAAAERSPEVGSGATGRVSGSTGAIAARVADGSAAAVPAGTETGLGAGSEAGLGTGRGAGPGVPTQGPGSEPRPAAVEDEPQQEVALSGTAEPTGPVFADTERPEVSAQPRPEPEAEADDLGGKEEPAGDADPVGGPPDEAGTAVLSGLAGAVASAPTAAVSSSAGERAAGDRAAAGERDGAQSGPGADAEDGIQEQPTTPTRRSVRSHPVDPRRPGSAG